MRKAETASDLQEQQEEYIGFRSAYADQLLLQCTKGPDARLHFVSGNMGVRESWKIEDQKPRTAWNRITVTLSNRYLPGVSPSTFSMAHHAFLPSPSLHS